MRKAVVLFALLALALSACSAGAAPPMYIQPAELTEEETAIGELLGANTNQYLFDVALDGTAKSFSVRIYELRDGAWELFSGGGGMNLEEGTSKGRMAFGFEDLCGEFREAYRFGERSTSWTYSPSEGPDTTLGKATAFLANQTEIVYEREIPLAVQVMTAKDSILSYDPEYFSHPEEYEKHGYEHVYALTVTFSQEPVS